MYLTKFSLFRNTIRPTPTSYKDRRHFVQKEIILRYVIVILEVIQNYNAKRRRIKN